MRSISSGRSDCSVCCASLVSCLIGCDFGFFFPFCSPQRLKQASLDGFARTVSKEDARPMHEGESIPKWKFNASQALCLTRTVADWILRDGLHPSAVEGDGFIQLMKIAEPRFVVPSRTYFTQVFNCFCCFSEFLIHFCVSDRISQPV